MPGVTITVPNVGIKVLRKQRDTVLIVKDTTPFHDQKTIDNLEGLINLLDTMLDIAEGYAVTENGK